MTFLRIKLLLFHLSSVDLLHLCRNTIGHASIVRICRRNPGKKKKLNSFLKGAGQKCYIIHICLLKNACICQSTKQFDSKNNIKVFFESMKFSKEVNINPVSVKPNLKTVFFNMFKSSSQPSKLQKL